MNEQIDELIGTPDPVLGEIINKRLEADHIVSVDRITKMDGFDKLTKEQQIQILNYKDNFIGLTKSANTSKDSKTFQEWISHKGKGISVKKEFREK